MNLIDTKVQNNQISYKDLRILFVNPQANVPYCVGFNSTQAMINELGWLPEYLTITGIGLPPKGRGLRRPMLLISRRDLSGASETRGNSKRDSD